MIANPFSAFTRTILKSVYGFDVDSMRDPFVVNAEEVMSSFAAAGIPGAFLVDTLPIRALSCLRGHKIHLYLHFTSVKHVPSWFPFAEFKKKAEYWKGLLPMFVDGPFDDVKMRMVRQCESACPSRLTAN
jgi:hypothetical protein